jgi:bifunctional ADP-heptose synthase (sugar kinase/adenylyltransferase)
MTKILVIGESCKDIFHYGACHRLCPEAPVPVFNPVEKTENGGMAMNVYNNIKAMPVACDIITNTNWESIHKVRFIDKKRNQMFIRVDFENNGISPISTDRLRDIKDYDAVIISDYNKGFLSEDAIAQICKSHDSVFLDTKKPLGSWCDDVLYIKINIHELNRTKQTIKEDMRAKLIVTLGEDGCLYQGKTYPVKNVEMKDSSGAGDTFISALTVKYLENKNIIDAIKFANECATIVVQKRGVGTI